MLILFRSLRMPSFSFPVNGMHPNFTGLFPNGGIRAGSGAGQVEIMIGNRRNAPAGWRLAQVGALVEYCGHVFRTEFKISAPQFGGGVLPLHGRLLSLRREFCKALFNRPQALRDRLRIRVAAAIQRGRQHGFLLARFFDFFARRGDLAGELMQTNRRRKAVGIPLGLRRFPLCRLGPNLLSDHADSPGTSLTLSAVLRYFCALRPSSERRYSAKAVLSRMVSSACAMRSTL